MGALSRSSRRMSSCVKKRIDNGNNHPADHVSVTDEKILGHYKYPAGRAEPKSATRKRLLNCAMQIGPKNRSARCKEPLESLLV